MEQHAGSIGFAEGQGIKPETTSPALRIHPNSFPAAAVNADARSNAADKTSAAIPLTADSHPLILDKPNAARRKLAIENTNRRSNEGTPVTLSMNRAFPPQANSINAPQPDSEHQNAHRFIFLSKLRMFHRSLKLPFYITTKE
ncbi:hypothetical protein [Paenibacillus humicola]|uniref:hypothetical protein n=1 Tax=Paenibacillus humicola TaxID=3110540 RepID=UPI00237B4569|nr:hypothetical protein [Paenibacillus humicola]